MIHAIVEEIHTINLVPAFAEADFRKSSYSLAGTTWTVDLGREIPVLCSPRLDSRGCVAVGQIKDTRWEPADNSVQGY
jgi:hypothetical protein